MDPLDELDELEDGLDDPDDWLDDVAELPQATASIKIMSEAPILYADRNT